MFDNAKTLFASLVDQGLPHSDHVITANNTMLVPFQDCPFSIKVNSSSYTIIPDGTITHFRFNDEGKVFPTSKVVTFRTVGTLLRHVLLTYTYIQNVKELNEQDQNELDIMVNARLREIMSEQGTLIISVKHKNRRAGYLDYIARQLGATRFLTCSIEYKDNGEVRIQRVTKSISDDVRADMERAKNYQNRRPDWRSPEHLYKEPLHNE